MSLDQVADRFKEYFSKIVAPTGIALNLFSFYIFSRPNLNKTNMGFLYRWQICVDVIVLVFYTFGSGSNFFFGWQFSELSPATCPISSFLIRCGVHFSSWTTLFITFDRYLLVRIKRNRSIMNKKLFVTVFILLMFTIIALVDIDNLFFKLEQPSVSSNSTQTNSTFPREPVCHAPQDWLGTFADIKSAILRTYIPLLLMITMDLMILRYMRGKRRELFKASHSSKPERHFTGVVIAINCVFFTFNFPLSVMFVVRNVINDQSLTATQQSTINFVVTVAVLFAFMNQILSFFTYLAINHLFRRELLLICGIVKMHQVTQNIELAGTSYTIRRDPNN
nr:G protein-coupled receptor [Proales similis]